MATFDQLQTWFSGDRLAPYEVEARGDHALAVRLYEWNAQLSAAFMEVLHHVEVVLRNRMHEAITAAYPDNPDPWFRQDGIFKNERGPDLIAEAEVRVRSLSQDVTTPRIVAALPFGFWNGLLTRSYEDLWRECLHTAFMGAKGRKQVVSITEQVRLWRNRVAHHERLFHKDMRSQHDHLVKLAMWCGDGCRDWILAQSRVPAMIQQRPK